MTRLVHASRVSFKGSGWRATLHTEVEGKMKPESMCIPLCKKENRNLTPLNAFSISTPTQSATKRIDEKRHGHIRLMKPPQYALKLTLCG